MSRRRGVSARVAAVRRAVSGAMLLAAVAVAGCGGSGEPGVVELKIGHVGAPGSLYDVVANEFASRVNERLAGRAEMVVFGASQLGGDEAMLQRLRLGTLDMSTPSTVMSSVVESFGLFELPYLVRDRAHMRQIEEAVVWPDLAPDAEEAGYKVLAVWENGFRHITNSTRPITGPEDLDGVKLRTPRGVWRVKLFQAFGANPTPMAFSEVFVALQTGVMDGQENPLTQVTSAKLHEVQDYLSLTSHVYTPSFLMTAANHWANQPEDIRLAVEEVARGMQSFVHETAERLDEELLVELEATGIQINEVEPSRFDGVSRLVYEEFAQTVEGGRALIDKATQAGS